MDAASFFAGAVVGGALLALWVAYVFVRTPTGEEWASQRPAIYEATTYSPDFRSSSTSARGVFTTFVSEFVLANRPRLRRYTHEDRYGRKHQEERAKFAEVIREHGGICMEVECVKKSRRIKPGAYWHLAHDHSAGHPHAYLGPAHPECNEAEARARGVTWEGMDAQMDPWAAAGMSNDPWGDPEAAEQEGPPWTASLADEWPQDDDSVFGSGTEYEYDDPWTEPPPDHR